MNKKKVIYEMAVTGGRQWRLAQRETRDEEDGVEERENESF